MYENGFGLGSYSLWLVFIVFRKTSFSRERKDVVENRDVPPSAITIRFDTNSIWRDNDTQKLILLRRYA